MNKKKKIVILSTLIIAVMIIIGIFLKDSFNQPISKPVSISTPIATVLPTVSATEAPSQDPQAELELQLVEGRKIDLSELVGRRFPICGIKDVINVYPEKNGTLLLYYIDLCLQQSGDINNSSLKFYIVLAKEDGWLKLREHIRPINEHKEYDSNAEWKLGRIVWIKEDEAGSPTMVLIKGKRYLFEYLVHKEAKFEEKKDQESSYLTITGEGDFCWNAWRSHQPRERQFSTKTKPEGIELLLDFKESENCST